MKLAAMTMAYRDAETIRGTLACLAPHVEKHFVMLQDKPYFGDYEPPDATEAICRSFPNVEVIKGNWEEHVLRNLGLDLCKGYDWMLGFDADEMMTSNDIQKLKAYLTYTPFDAVGFISKVYWRNLDYRFHPYPDHVKVCVIRPSSDVRYVDKQCVNSSYVTLTRWEPPFVVHHHLSWCEPKNILRKVVHCGHANEYNGAEWYEKYFKNWKEGDPVYQPYMTKWEAVKEPLPEELRKLL